jgi:hypothetical protein
MMIEPDGKHPGGGDISVPAVASNRLSLYFYLTPLVALPLLILAAAIFIVPSDWLAEHSGNPFLVTLGYGGMLHNTQCDILVYGDSTAMIGVNPSVIRERTGLPTCNIAETEGMTMVNGTMILDQFLEHNPRPRFLVFLYSPEGLDPQTQRHNTEVTTFEAVMYRFRQPNKLADLIVVMKHPEDFFSWAEHGIRMSMSAISAKPLSPDIKLTRFKTLGQSPLNNTLLTSCSYGRHNTPPDKAWINALRTQYSTNGTTVLFDAMLLPDCDPDINYFRAQLPGVIDNQVDTLPMADYFNGGRHVTPAGSVSLSNMIAGQVLDRLHAPHDAGAN